MGWTVHDAALNLMTDTKAVISGTAGLGIYFGVGPRKPVDAGTGHRTPRGPIRGPIREGRGRQKASGTRPRPLLPPRR
jgi:hypothetical protein